MSISEVIMDSSSTQDCSRSSLQSKASLNFSILSLMAGSAFANLDTLKKKESKVNAESKFKRINNKKLEVLKKAFLAL